MEENDLCKLAVKAVKRYYSRYKGKSVDESDVFSTYLSTVDNDYILIVTNFDYLMFLVSFRSDYTEVDTEVYELLASMASKVDLLD